MRPTRGIPSKLIHVMDHALLEQLSGHAPGDYRRDPHGVYLDFQRSIGACMIDQYLAENPLTMSDRGYDPADRRAPTHGLDSLVLDGITIDSPEAVVEHLERVVFPDIRRQISTIPREADAMVERLVRGEIDLQHRFGPNLLKAPYGGFQAFPAFRYTKYGYSNYFMAYALYPEVIAQDFCLQADYAVLRNAISARAIVEGRLPRLVRLDHDMADSRGPLVNIQSLEAIWFPQFARAIQPLVDAGIRLLWHCDGNVMPMVPGLIASGVRGFQGFQYEDGVDYPALCRMKDRDGQPLMIWAGVSVTQMLPHGTPDDVRKQLRWLVENGPPVGLFLGGSSSIVPGTPHDNIKALIEGLAHYREHGRQ